MLWHYPQISWWGWSEDRRCQEMRTHWDCHLKALVLIVTRGGRRSASGSRPSAPAETSQPSSLRNKRSRERGQRDTIQGWSDLLTILVAASKHVNCLTILVIDFLSLFTKMTTTHWSSNRASYVFLTWSTKHKSSLLPEFWLSGNNLPRIKLIFICYLWC